MKSPMVLLAAVLVEGTFWDGVGHALSVADIPHGPEAWGQLFTIVLTGLLSEAFRAWRTRKQVRRELPVAVAQAASPKPRPAKLLRDILKKRKCKKPNV